MATLEMDAAVVIRVARHSEQEIPSEVLADWVVSLHPEADMSMLVSRIEEARTRPEETHHTRVGGTAHPAKR